MAAVSHVDLVYDNGSSATEYKFWSLFYPQISASSDLQFWTYSEISLFYRALKNYS